MTKEHIRVLREAKAIKAKIDAEVPVEKPAFDL